jgi:hypothetical protein
VTAKMAGHVTWLGDHMLLVVLIPALPIPAISIHLLYITLFLEFHQRFPY